MTHNAIMAASNGTVTINDSTAKTGVFGGVWVSTAGTVTAILDKNGNNVTSELITTTGNNVDLNTWITPHAKHGWFSSIEFDTARGTAVLANPTV